jgi:pimeloyl-ACP methyl ester carboxylesterase
LGPQKGEIADANLMRPLSAAEQASFKALSGLRRDLTQYLGSSDPTDLWTHQCVSESFRTWNLPALIGASAPSFRMLIVCDQQDLEPITQAYWLEARLPSVEVALINRAGHLTWLEQPDAVCQTLQAFLES